jgi:sarcosine oxidase/L-pipecolate oxidase
MPPGKDGILKFIRNLTFKNTTFHPQTGEMISMPPAGPQYNQWSPCQGLKDELEIVRKGIYGDLTNGLRFEKYRICWDAIAPDVNFFITPHPIQGLYIATGGSFHGWKMMPVLGKYVIQMLQDKLSDEYKMRWAWERPMPSVPRGYTPKRELRDI